MRESVRRSVRGSVRGSVRAHLLRALAARAASDPHFLREVRRDPGPALARYGFELTRQELALVQRLGRQTASMTDGRLTRLLGDNLRARAERARPARPAAPTERNTNPGRPRRPGT